MALFGHYEVVVLDAADRVVRSDWRVATTGAPHIGQTLWFEGQQYLVVHVDNQEKAQDDGGPVYTYPSVRLRELRPTLVSGDAPGKPPKPAAGTKGIATVTPFTRTRARADELELVTAKLIGLPFSFVLAVVAQGYRTQASLFTEAHRAPKGSTLWFCYEGGPARHYTREELWSLSRDAKNGLEDLLDTAQWYASQAAVREPSGVSSASSGQSPTRTSESAESSESNGQLRAKLRLV